jgi:endoglucanase
MVPEEQRPFLMTSLRSITLLTLSLAANFTAAHTRQMICMIHRIFMLTVILLPAISAPTTAAPPQVPDAFAINHRLGRGVNIIGWDPLWQDFTQGHFKDEHFKLIREAGFDHVRINLHPLRDGKPDASGKMRGQFFRTVDWAIDQALANNLLAILDYHDDLEISPDPAGKRQVFLATWTAIAEHCKDRPAEVLFEILNEPAGKFTHETWNEYHKDALEIIRRTNPTRTVIIGPARWNGVKELDKLILPENDRNIIATFHYYNPFDFTHQGTPWTDQRDKSGVTWKSTPEQQQAVLRDFSGAETWAKQHNRPLYLGEFGAYDKADMDSRVRYIGFIAREAEKRGWSWAHWQFANDFTTYDNANKRWVEPIRDALVPPGKAQP